MCTWWSLGPTARWQSGHQKHKGCAQSTSAGQGSQTGGSDQHKHMMIKVKVRWTPGHKGISENKQADVEVKRAAWGESSQQHWLPLACRGIILASRSAAQQGYMKGAKDKARKLFAG